MKKKLSYIPLVLIVLFLAGCAATSPTAGAPSPIVPPAASSIAPSTQPSQGISQVVHQPADTSTPAPSDTPSPSALPSTATPTQSQALAPTPTPTAQPPAPSATPAAQAPAPAPTTLASPTPTAVSGAGQSGASGSACQDEAAFYGDVTIPDDTVFRQQTNFSKTWQIKNTGTCTWGSGYSLVFAGGDIMNGPQSVPLPSVKPGDIFNISVNLTSPTNGGTYLGDWVFQRPDGTRFGVNSDGVDMIWVKIDVSYIVIGPTATPNPNSSNCTGQTNPDYINTVLTLINNARTSNGLQPLTLNAQLSAAAQAHSTDMACNNFVDHVGSDGSTWFTRIKAQGYTYSYASENIYVGNPAFGGDANGAFTWWMNSQVHRDNILSPKITQIGIGYAFYDKATYGGYFTVDFAHP